MKRKKQAFSKQLIKKRVKTIQKKLFQFSKATVRIPVMAIIYAVAGGILFLISFSLYDAIKLQNVKTQMNQKQPEPELHHRPEYIHIPKVSIDLPILPASVSENNWEVFTYAVSWLKTSGDLNGGNIILYGHNSQDLFGTIIQLAPGDEIEVKNAFQEKKFRVEKVYQTNREDISALEGNDDRITMYTCSGWFDANRFFVIGKPIGE